jgi:enoyl-CoA hydratase/carnithine racemase
MIFRPSWRSATAISTGHCRQTSSPLFVQALARRIASFPAHAIAHAKAAVDVGAFSSMSEGLLVEARESDLSVASDVTQARVKETLNVGAETYEGELDLGLVSRLSPSK